MAQNTMVATDLGDALRRLADRVDGAPALLGAATHPLVPHTLQIHVRSADAVRVLARDLDARVVEHVHAERVHTSFEVVCFPVGLRVFNISPAPSVEAWNLSKERAEFLAAPPDAAARELRRPVDVTEQIEAGL